MPSLTQEQALAVFEYKNGELYWKIRPCNSIQAGEKVGSLDRSGYLRFKYKNHRLLVHRVIYLIHKGHMPDIIDHIDNNKLNNNIENLREATKSQNCLNKKIRKDSFSGIKNVCWSKQNNKWKVGITNNKKRIHIGYFTDIEEAKIAAIQFGKQFHGTFYREA